MLYEIAMNYHSPFIPFAPYPTITDRTAWENLDEEWKKASLQLGEQYLHFSYPALSAMDFMDFTRTGNRVRYEDKFFSKRHALNALVLAECIEDNGRFMDDIVNGIFSICEESAWQLPPHNSYMRDT
ncbi:MAG: heparinase, partial [Lachnospiraceae bacterium]|nr:heparinase [Lachnospiraceae bacterium]